MVVKMMTRKIIAVGFGVALSCGSLAETLYNGIKLPAEWPPARDPSREYAMPVPYLWAANRPKVIPIDLGRQLFVDDFLIKKTDLERVYPHPVKYEGNPVLRPETEIELNRPGNAGASPVDGGLWWDPEKGKFRYWYGIGWAYRIGYAESDDGIHFTRVPTDSEKGTNYVLPDQWVGSWSVFRDYENKDPSKRWQLFIANNIGPDGKRSHISLGYVSEDGIHWNGPHRLGYTDDRSTFFYNPFRRVWGFNLRINDRGHAPKWPESRGRSCAYAESPTFPEGCEWNWGTKVTGKDKTAVIWQQADALDPVDPQYPDSPQLYNVDAVAYESIMLSLQQIHHGPPNGVCDKKELPKITDLCFAYSRDGFHYSRPDRTAAIASERWDAYGKKWDVGYVNPLSNICVIKDEKLYIYYGANEGFVGRGEELKGLKEKFSKDEIRARSYGSGLRGMYDRRATGLAILRRDGFAGLRAGDKKGTVTTRPVQFSGKRLFVNVEAPKGVLKAEVLDAEKDEVLFVSEVVRGDHTKIEVADVSAYANRPVRLRFTVKRGTFYSFWVAPDASGKSGGYLAGGGPDYPGLRDL